MKQLTYQDALAFIHGRTKFKKIPTLDRMRDFCKRLGDPQQNLKMIHVTGTNGKGSTTAYIRQLLIENGFKVDGDQRKGVNDGLHSATFN